MKNRILAILGLVLLAAGSASAQTPSQFKVPFPFMVAGKMLPAADYRVVLTHSTGQVMLLPSKGTGAFTITEPDGYRPELASQDALSFERYGSTWVLRKVRISGYEQETNVSKAKRKELARLDRPGQQTLTASVLSTH